MSPRHIGLLAALSAIWGGSYLLIKYALEDFSAPMISPAALFVALFAPFIDPSERIDRRQGIGMLIGLAGVALVVGVESISTLAQFLGALAMVAAAAFYALGGFVVKRRYGRLTSIQASFVSISAASLWTLPAALATAPTETPGLGAVAAVGGLGVIATALAFVIFYTLIAEVGAGRAALVSYLAPGVALFYGATFLDEAITPAAIAGLVLILGGVALASRPRREQVPEPVACPDHGPEPVAGRA